MTNLSLEDDWGEAGPRFAWPGRAVHPGLVGSA